MHAQDLGARQLQSPEQPPTQRSAHKCTEGACPSAHDTYKCLPCTPHYATSESWLLPRDVFKLTREGDQSEGAVTDQGGRERVTRVVTMF